MIVRDTRGYGLPCPQLQPSRLSLTAVMRPYMELLSVLTLRLTGRRRPRVKGGSKAVSRPKACQARWAASTGGLRPGGPADRPALQETSLDPCKRL